MNKATNEWDRGTELICSEHADHSSVAAKTLAAFSILRLLNDNCEPVAFWDVTERARQVKATFKRWEISRALIQDISVRLSDGKEISLDQSNSFSCFGLRFRNSFPAHTVLHVYKKADKHFGEVLLLSVRLQGISSSFEYERTYQNGQQISLNATRSQNGQLLVALDCSNPASKPETVPEVPANRLQSPLAGAWQERFKNMEIFRQLIPTMACVSLVVAFCVSLWLQHGEGPSQIPFMTGGIESSTVSPGPHGEKRRKPQTDKPSSSAKPAPAKVPTGIRDMSKALAERARELAVPVDAVNQFCAGARKNLDRRIEGGGSTTNVDDEAGKPALECYPEYPFANPATPPLP